ncbi:MULTISPECIES: ABC exporter membrane fusion protein [Nostocales]|uniref:ABC exporter membrane fusion protein n=3 Tax=Nostocales TaxID=1161 RepID=A0A0C1NCB6_9CYAN|nr:ABC exporter membrane fusion protein [Tolypothrix bouteillei]KAF3886344.1 ABC exporter membrane fusion protein [Tolypothrix bouteillei VB521301]
MVSDATKTTSNSSVSFKQKRHPVFVLGIATTLVISGVTIYQLQQFQAKESSQPQVPQAIAPKVTKVVALGKLEPQGEVIKVSAPTSSQENRVEQLLVKEGQEVKAGQAIAILDSKDRLQASLVKAQEQVKIKQANLAQVKAGAKRGEIDAQRAQIDRLKAQWEGDQIAQEETIARIKAQWEGDKTAQQATIGKLEAELNNARSEYKRYEQLAIEGAISKSSFDSKRLSLDTATQQLNEAKAVLNRIDSTSRRQLSEAQAVLSRINTTGKRQVNEAQATLQKIAEVRPVDIELAIAEVNDAIAEVNQAKKNLEQAYVRSPQNGQILDIHTRAGEVVSQDGIVEIGQTSQMYVVAEVYQSDINKVRLGQQVRVTSDSFSKELQGKVDLIGLQVKRQSVVNTDPSSNIDARVVEVHIRLDNASSTKAAKLTNLQVKAVIEI